MSVSVLSRLLELTNVVVTLAHPSEHDSSEVVEVVEVVDALLFEVWSPKPSPRHNGNGGTAGARRWDGGRELRR